MTNEERTNLSNNFLIDLKKIMEKHQISMIRVFDGNFFGFTSDGKGVFECSRLEHHGDNMPHHDELNTDWEVYTP